MKNKIFNKTIAVFLISIFVFGQIPQAVFAQPNPPSPAGEVRGFNQSVFDSHFSRADREINPERWLAEAKFGVTQAILSWEIIAFGLYEDPNVFEEAKMQLENWSNEELEARFSQWLTGRFFGKAIEKAVSELSAMFGETQKNYTWRLDDEGNVIFDDNTGDPLIIRPGEENREFSHDLLKWQNETENLVKTNTAFFESTMLALYPELLAYIPPELYETMSSLILETGASTNETIKREFENIAAREERIFTSRRTRDIWSLRKKSDDESARLFTERLINEAEEACAKGIEELNARIEDASAGTGDLALLGEEWLRLYKEQFEKGLKAWEEAEERFFMRRIEWEQDSLKLFSEGEETWLTSFNKFEEERRKWELKAKELFQSGELLFKNISENLEKNIADAKKEFEINMAMRIGTGTEKVKALIDMYLTIGSAVITTKGNISFWMGEYGGEKDVSDSDFSDWLSEERMNFGWQNESDYMDSDDYTKGKFEALLEIQKSYELYSSYMEKALDTRGRILSDYAQLIGTGSLKDILSPDASSEDFCLDEYQIALIRAKALVLYWERKTEIAQAVMSYAKEIDAGRMTDAEGIRAWEDAKTAYNNSLLTYEAELSKLSAIGENIENQQLTLNELAQEMSDAENRLTRLNKEYSAILAASLIDTKDIVAKDFKTGYDLLLLEYKHFQKQGTEAAYKNVLEYGYYFGIAEQREISEKILGLLINGDGKEMPSLDELSQNISEGEDAEINLKLRYAGIDLFAGIISEIPLTEILTYNSADWYSKAKGIELSEEEKASLFGEKLGARLVVDYKKSFSLLLQSAIDFELAILSAFLNEETEEDAVLENAMSRFFMSNRETAAIVYAALLALEERAAAGNEYFSENDEENNIIGLFISEISSFAGTEHPLIEYFNEYNFSAGLLDIYNNYAQYSFFVRQEIWQNTLYSLEALFSGYNIDFTQNVFPDAKNIYNSIGEKSGDFAQNAAQFIRELDKCFSLAPRWIETEIKNWKDAVIDYIAANMFFSGIKTGKDKNTLLSEYEEINALYINTLEAASSMNFLDDNEMDEMENTLAEIYDNLLLHYYMIVIEDLLENLENAKTAAGSDKHWREYLGNSYIENPDSVLTESSTWKAGTLADALYKAVYYTNRINDSFALFSQEAIDNSGGNAQFYYSIYKDEEARLDMRFHSLKNKYDELANLGRSFDIAKYSREEAAKELEPKLNELKVHENAYNTLRNSYLLEADIFFDIGVTYDNQYSVLKKAYDNTDEKRFEYEKQDAIRRWASTAYLDSDIINPEYSQEKLAKAQIVLSALSDMYDDENSRTYENPAYNALYSDYKQSFSIKLKVLETLGSVSSVLAQEESNNEKLFHTYQYYLESLGNIDKNYFGYVLPDSKEAWSIKNIITLKDGCLVFSKDVSMTITGIGQAEASALDNYFNSKKTINGEYFEISDFDEAARGLSQRMIGYFNNSGKFRQWSLARDYLLLSLINANGDLPFLNNFYSGMGEANKNGEFGKQLIKENRLQAPISIHTYLTRDFSSKDLWDFISNIGNSDKRDPLGNKAATAWNELSAEEKADLEFYVILTLSGNNHYFEGFSKAATLDIYEEAYNYVSDRYRYANKEAQNWLNLGSFNEMRDINRNTLNRITSTVTTTRGLIQKWTSELQNNLSSIQQYASLYRESCEVLDSLKGEKSSGQKIEWADISDALLTAGKTNSDNFEIIKTCWEEMQTSNNETFQDVNEAFAALLQWVYSAENNSRSKLENYWLKEAQAQRKNELEYHNAEEAFMNGTIGVKALKSAAAKAYGNTTAWKNHFENMHTALMDDLSTYLNKENDYYSEFNILGNEITLLTQRTLESRFMAEFSARETEWDQMRQDISEKYYEWMDTSAKILENGRTEWNSGLQKLEESYRQWVVNFQNEYNRVNDEWNEAYLAGLEDKERWLEQAANAANQASAESFLSLVGAEGERLSRFMDTREPFGIRNAAPEAETLMTELLQSSGIFNMADAFGSLNNIANNVSSVVRRGMGGISTWDMALAKTAASDLARKTNAELAVRETRKLAHIASLYAEDAIKNLADNVDTANKNFQESMDSHFILNGLWNKSGNNYVKNIIKGSTLFQPIISETVTITGYENYKMESVSLNTDLSESSLANLDSAVIWELIKIMQKEVEEIKDEIFGIGKKPEKISAGRELSPGKFGTHIGYAPDVKKEIKDIKRKSIFNDEGSGETGRLIANFIYWSYVDGKGTGELATAAWDKRMWDDEGSFFEAPTLRAVGQIACSVATTVMAATLSATIAVGTFGAGTVGSIALMVLVASSSDLLFGTLDATTGYKTIEEAGFEMGKSLLINTASSVIGLGTGLASSAINTSNTVANAMLKGAVSGAGSYATSVTNSYIQSYDFKTGKMDWGTANASWYSANTIAGAFGAGVSGGVGSYLKNTKVLSDAQQKYMGGAINLATAGSGELAKYGIYTAYNLGAGMGLENSFKKAYDDMGGLTINIANLGAMFDFVMSTAARNNWLGQLANSDSGINFVGNLQQELSKVGLLEVKFGTNGINAKFGTGGIDVGGSIYNLAKRGIDYSRMLTNNKDLKVKETVIEVYGLGDWTAENTAMRITSGLDELKFDSKSNRIGHTVLKASGKGRTITIQDSGDVSRNAITLQHEAYRNGIVTNDNYLETRMAVLAHTKMAKKMFDSGQVLMDTTILNDLVAYSQGMDYFNAYVDRNYDSSGDYWKLTKNGNLEYDGFATLRDANGNILKSYREMGLRTDNSIEGSLLWLLGINPNDSTSVHAVRMMMAKSGLKHSFGLDSNNWFWRGEDIAITTTNGYYPTVGTVNLTDANMGKTITINTISELFSTIGASGTTTNNSINRIYGSAVSFLNYADAGGNTTIANSMLSNYYNSSQLAMIQANQSWLNNALKNGVNIDGMVQGNARRSGYFQEIYNDLPLKREEPTDPYYIYELHPGVDIGRGGTSVIVPGGYWELVNKDNHKAYYNLYGSDLTMRIQHLKPASIGDIGNIYGGNNTKLVDYPTELYGAGDGPHIHIDMTMSLPYNLSYVRQFVNPDTLKPGNQLEYPIIYKDENKNVIPGRSNYYGRYKANGKLW
jgi:hypothetical protein